LEGRGKTRLLKQGGEKIKSSEEEKGGRDGRVLKVGEKKQLSREEEKESEKKGFPWGGRRLV